MYAKILYYGACCMRAFIPHSKPEIDNDDLRSIEDVLKTGQIGWGQEVEKFEQDIKNFLNVKDVIAVDSGSSALHLALISLGISKNDRVLLPSYCCSAVLNAVNYTGAQPVFCDIEEPSLNISPRSIKKHIIRKTKAIIVPHMFGCPAKIEEIKKFGIPVIEDCAVALGGVINGKKLGTFGRLAISSFYATKLMATGKGGVIICSKAKEARIIKDLVNYDNRPDYKIRYNYRMSALQAALGRAQLRRLPDFVKRRRRIAEIYFRGLEGLPGIALPPKNGHLFYRFVINAGKQQKKFIKYMSMNGIECKRPVFKPLHLYFAHFKKSCPISEKVHRQYVSLPIYPSLAESDTEYIIGKIIEFVKSL
jgi:perosamine synthetase